MALSTGQGFSSTGMCGEKVDRKMGISSFEMSYSCSGTLSAGEFEMWDISITGYWRVCQDWEYTSVWGSCVIRRLSAPVPCARVWRTLYGVRGACLCIWAACGEGLRPRGASLTSTCLLLQVLFVCTGGGPASCVCQTVILQRPCLFLSSQQPGEDSLSLHPQKTEGLEWYPAQDLAGQD